MELSRFADHRYTLHRSEDGVVYILRWLQPSGDAEQPRFATRHDLTGSYATLADAYQIAKTAAEKLESGDLGFIRERLKKKIREYEVQASAEFRTGPHRWQPVATIVSLRPKNKGEKQDLGAHDSALSRNLFDTAPAAAKYALEIGERTVLGFIGGLRV